MDNLAKVFHLLKKNDLRLNQDKCSFGVQVEEPLGFVLRHRGNEANLSKCMAIIEMKTQTKAKELQILTGKVGQLYDALTR